MREIPHLKDREQEFHPQKAELLFGKKAKEEIKKDTIVKEEMIKN